MKVITVKTFIDLSHDIENRMTTYKGLPSPVIRDYLSREDSRSHYSNGTEFFIGSIEMVRNTGTYLDSPFHRHANGKDLSHLPLSSLADLDGIVVRIPRQPTKSIDAACFGELDLEKKAVLIHTGWAKHWRTEQYFTGHPFLTRDAAQLLVERKASLVGIDSYNIDSTADGGRPVHTLLLQADIPIVEHMCNLETLPEKGFSFFAVPTKVKGFASFPVRAFAILQ